MKLRAEISLYPLKDEFIPLIDDFITRINHHKGVNVWTNDMSTQIFGEYDVIMKIIHEEMKTSFENYSKMIFVAKFHSPAS